MSELGVTKLEPGRPFPFPVPNREGAYMALWEIGPVVMIQKFGVKDEHMAAFRKGFDEYCYLEGGKRVPVALWSFAFPEPLGIVDMAFNSGTAKREWVASYLNTRAGGVMNAVYFFLLEGKILKASKMVGLDPEAVVLFHGTITRQLDTNPGSEAFLDELKILFKKKPEDLFQQGKIFRFAEEEGA